MGEPFKFLGKKARIGITRVDDKGYKSAGGTKIHKADPARTLKRVGKSGGGNSQQARIRKEAKMAVRWNLALFYIL